MFSLTRLHVAVLSAIGVTVSADCWAQEAQFLPSPPVDSVAAHTPPVVVVNATRQPSPVLTTPATITVIDETQLQENLVTDFRELFRYEPGITVKREPRGRGDESGIEVRGIGGQRLGLLVDGVRLPAGYVAAGANLGQLKLDPLSLSRVEVLRGPASSLYGSDALAGVVLFRTLSPQDFLDSTKAIAGSASAGFDGSDDSRWASGNLAFRAGALQNLLSLTTREGHERKNYHDSALHPNPQEARQHNLLIKSVLDIDAIQALTLIAEHYDQSIKTNQVSLIGPIAGGTRINDSRADDDSLRGRLGLNYRYAPTGTWFDNFSAQIDYQRSSSKERTYENRQPPGPTAALLRDGLLSYREPQWSGSAQFGGRIDAGAVAHRWVTGVDVLSKSVSLYNDALQRTVTGAGATNVIDGDVYPRKIAPDTDVSDIGWFAQDEMAFGKGALRFTPGLRIDAYKLSPHPDALFGNANVGGSIPVGLSKSALTPRLGLSYEWLPQQVAFANYVTGFRMPTYDQLNRIGRVPVATFIHDFIPAPNLKPERSQGIELGLRGQSGGASYDLSAYYNRYTDFISSDIIAVIPAGESGGPRPIRRIQSRNIGKVAIYGIEAKGQMPLHPWFDATDGWRLIGALQWSIGDDKVADQPLNSIQPARLVAGLRWDESAHRYGAQLTSNLVAGKKRVNQALTQTGPTAPVPLTTAGYGTADLTTYWRLSKRVTLNLAVYNLFDKRYFDWSNVSQLTGTDASLTSYTATGRNGSLSVKIEI